MALFEKAKSATVERILESSTFRRYSAGATISAEGDPTSRVFFLIEGVGRVHLASPNGTEYTPKIFCAPIHFGDLGALSRCQKNHASVEAMRDSIVAEVPAPTIEDCLADDHALCLSWLYSVARMHAVTIDSDRQNVFGGIAARLANVLLSYADVFGVDADGLRAIDFPLSYAKIAQQIACTRRNAIRMMQSMGEKKIVKQSQAGWLIDVAAFKELLIPGRLSLAHSLEAPPSSPGTPPEEAP